MKKTIFSMICLLICLIPVLAPECVVAAISILPDNGVTHGDVIIITGTGFAEDKTKVSMTYLSSDTQCTTDSNTSTVSCKMTKTDAKPAKKDDKSVKFINSTTIETKIPEDLLELPNTSIKISVSNNDNNSEDVQEITVKNNISTLVATAIELKNDGMSASAIAEYLHHQGEQEIEIKYIELDKQTALYDTYDRDDINSTAYEVFGNFHPKLKNGEEIVKLREAGFENDFIEKMTGQPQYITLGVAAVWLGQTHNYVLAPMARIFVQPAGYYAPRRTFEISHFIATWDWQKVGINIGYTPATATTKTYGSAATETKNYMLIGLSYEINRSALLNLGMAVAPGGSLHGSRQFYAGFTIDQNILKGLGLMKD